jgi:uncharacterized membrane protein YcaP (DUF421 family)
MVGESALVAIAVRSSTVQDLLHIDIPPIEKVLRTVAVYLGILFIIRFAGKRLMAQMNSLDLVVVLLLSNVVQNAIIGQDNSLVGGLLGALVLVVVNALLDRWAQRNSRVDWLLNGRPTVVIRDGEVDDVAVRRLGMSPQELGNALRRQGVDSAAEVAYAAMEPGGTLTVRLKPGERSATIGDLRRAVAELTARLEQRPDQP